MSLLRTPMRLAAAVAVAGALAGGALAVSSTPAFAAAMTGTTLSVSNNAASSTNVTNQATYTWNFTTASEAMLTSVTMTVPTSTTPDGALTVEDDYGLDSCGTVTAAVASTTVTVSFSTPCDIAAGTPISIAIGTFNTPTAGTFAGSTVTTNTSGGANDTGTSNSIDFSGNTTQVTVVVPNSLTFTNANPSISLLPVPGAPATADVALGVATNETAGYTLSGCMQDPLAGTTNSSNTIPALTATAEALPGATATQSGFGASANSSLGPSALQGNWKGTGGSLYAGYATCSPEGTNYAIVQGPGPTNGDTLTLTNGVGVNNMQAADAYQGTIEYQVTPSY